MRVTTGMAVGTLTSNLGRSYERITRFQNQLSSGTRLNKLSDDPAGVERSLALRSELRNTEQFQKNIADGVGWLQLSEATLNSLETLFVEARGLAVHGATSTYNSSQRNAIADELHDAYAEGVASWRVHDNLEATLERLQQTGAGEVMVEVGARDDPEVPAPTTSRWHHILLSFHT